MFNMIAAVSKNGVIGINNSIPWKCSADFQYFKKTTMNNVVVMGRKTYESLFDYMIDKSKEPLPGRIKYVITTEPEKINIRPNVFVCPPFNDPLEIVYRLSEKFLDKDIFVIGGAQIYKLFEGYYQNIYLTRIDKNYFPTYISDLMYYFPIKDSVLVQNYELLYTQIVENDIDTQSVVRYEQWRLSNLFGN